MARFWPLASVFNYFRRPKASTKQTGAHLDPANNRRQIWLASGGSRRRLRANSWP